MKQDKSKKTYTGTFKAFGILKEKTNLLLPPPNRSAWQWAEEKRFLPKGSAEPGRFNCARAPWVKVLTEQVRNPNYNKIIAVMGSQMSKTEGVLLNVIGWKLTDDPQPILYIGPTEKNVKSIAGSAMRDKGRVGQMIRQVPELWNGLIKGKDESIYEKIINGVRLGFGWAGSATELSSHAAALGLLDEYDRMQVLQKEGDPLELLEARVSTYPNGTIIVTSTPLEGSVEEETLETGLNHWAVTDPEYILSPTWLLWQMSTRHEWSVPCPECEEYFIPKSSLIYCPEDATPYQALKETKLTCPHCGFLIDNNYKTNMNAKGVAVAPGQTVTRQGVVEGPLPENSSFGLWVSGLCSEWRTFGERQQRYLNALKSGDQERIRATVNTAFGELYKRTIVKLPWEDILKLKSGYKKGELPVGIYRIICTVDVQKNRLVYVIRAWLRMKSWKIDSGELYGDTEETPVWQMLGKLLHTRIEGRQIDVMLIDEGYLKEQVYKFCRTNPQRAAPCKGVESLDVPYRASSTEVDANGKRIKEGLQRFLFESSRAKSFVHSQIADGMNQKPQWLVDDDTEDGYCKEIFGEILVQKGKRYLFEKLGPNHYLDCEAMQWCAANILGAEYMTDGLKKENRPREHNLQVRMS